MQIKVWKRWNWKRSTWRNAEKYLFPNYYFVKTWSGEVWLVTAWPFLIAAAALSRHIWWYGLRGTHWLVLMKLQLSCKPLNIIVHERFTARLQIDAWYSHSMPKQRDTRPYTLLMDTCHLHKFHNNNICLFSTVIDIFETVLVQFWVVRNVGGGELNLNLSLLPLGVASCCASIQLGFLHLHFTFYILYTRPVTVYINIFLQLLYYVW
jgi:hypothetical protein